MGVSPWIWWADVRIPHHEAVYIKNEPYVHKSPTVKYRGKSLTRGVALTEKASAAS